MLGALLEDRSRQSRELRKGAAVVVPGQFGGGEGAQFRPAGDVEISGVADVPEQTEPLDETAFDIARTEGERGCLGEEGVQLAAEMEGEDFGGPLTVGGRESDLKIARMVRRAVGSQASRRQPFAATEASA